MSSAVSRRRTAVSIADLADNGEKGDQRWRPVTSTPGDFKRQGGRGRPELAEDNPTARRFRNPASGDECQPDAGLDTFDEIPHRAGLLDHARPLIRGRSQLAHQLVVMLRIEVPSEHQERLAGEVVNP